MMGLPAVLIAIASAAVAAVSTGMLLPVLRATVVDLPNERSSHSVATPRGGGVGVIIGAAAGLAVAGFLGWPIPSARFLAGVCIVALIGFLDDRLRGLPVIVRLVGQVMVAGMLVWRFGPIPAFGVPGLFLQPLGAAAGALTVLWVVVLVNLYNFLDGIDGFAATQGAIAGFMLAVAFRGGPASAVALSVAGACCGFLRYNWRPARVFMGDVGSTTLGVIFAGLPLLLPPQERPFAAWTVLLCLWFFVADGVFTLFRRLLRGERIWQAHRSHLYQRLVATGLRHDQVVLAVMIPGAVLATCAVLGERMRSATMMGAVSASALVLFCAYWAWTAVREARVLQVTRLGKPGRHIDTSPARRVQ